MEISIEGSLFTNITCACIIIINQLFSVIKVSGGAGFFYLVCAHCDKDEFKIDNKQHFIQYKSMAKTHDSNHGHSVQMSIKTFFL